MADVGGTSGSMPPAPSSAQPSGAPTLETVAEGSQGGQTPPPAFGQEPPVKVVSSAPETLESLQIRVRDLEAELEAARAEAALQTQKVVSLEEKLHWLERMASLKLVIRGVAHEINNLLTGALGFTQILGRNALDADPREQRMVSTVASELSRCAELTRSLLEYAHTLNTDVEVFELESLVLEAVGGATPGLAAEGVHLDLAIEPGDSHLSGQRAQVLQIVKELIENAIQAVQTREGARWVRVRLGHEAETVILEVSDSGGGIAEPERVFQPFYSTRDRRPGAGLGLLMVQSAMKDQGGRVLIGQGPEGAVVTLRFPRYAGEAGRNRPGAGDVGG